MGEYSIHPFETYMTNDFVSRIEADNAVEGFVDLTYPDTYLGLSTIGSIYESN